MTFLEERIAANKAIILKYETAISTILAGAESYTLDTGQSRQTVTRSNIQEIQTSMLAAYGLLITLEGMLPANNQPLIARPAW